MSTSLISSQRQSGAITTAQQGIAVKNFDRLMMVLISWFVGGLYLDGWAHSHIPQLETFFTPWHGVLYSGYFACAVALVGATFINHRHGGTWREAIPAGYELALLGAPLFLLGGIADMTWHILFGIEKNTEALLSPTHLLLAVSAFLIMSGPFRAAWRRSEEGNSGWVNLLPMLISYLAIYSLLTFFTVFVHPFVHTELVTQAITNEDKSYGVAGVLVQSALMITFVLLAIKRWRLPFGAFALVFTLNAALMSVFSYQYRLIPSALIAGLVADLLLRYLQPSVQRQDMLRLFAFILPFVLYLCYFCELMLLYGTTWSIHLWLGSCFIAGIVGVGLSYLLVPPQIPANLQQGI